jgi:hypothetical protein
MASILSTVSKLQFSIWLIKNPSHNTKDDQGFKIFCALIFEIVKIRKKGRNKKENRRGESERKI